MIENEPVAYIKYSNSDLRKINFWHGKNAFPASFKNVRSNQWIEVSRREIQKIDSRGAASYRKTKVKYDLYLTRNGG